jgi:hypothetical protein
MKERLDEESLRQIQAIKLLLLVEFNRCGIGGEGDHPNVKPTVAEPEIYSRVIRGQHFLCMGVDLSEPTEPPEISLKLGLHDPPEIVPLINVSFDAAAASEEGGRLSVRISLDDFLPEDVNSKRDEYPEGALQHIDELLKADLIRQLLKDRHNRPYLYSRRIGIEVVRLMVQCFVNLPL